MNLEAKIGQLKRENDALRGLIEVLTGYEGERPKIVTLMVVPVKRRKTSLATPKPM